MCICQKNNRYLLIHIRKECKDERHCIFCFNCKCFGCYCFINNYLYCFLQKDIKKKGENFMSGYVEFRNKLLENPEVRAQYEAINYPRPRRDGV